LAGAPVAPDIRDTFRARVDALRPHVKECRAVDLDLGDMDRTFDILRAESFIAAFGAAIEENPDAFGPHIAVNVTLGLSMSLADRAWAHLEQTRILRKFNAVMSDLDIIVLPTSPVSPFPVDAIPRRLEIDGLSDGTSIIAGWRWPIADH
jgi:amidase